MIGWELGLIGSIVGIIVILVRRLPSAFQSLKEDPTVRSSSSTDVEPKSSLSILVESSPVPQDSESSPVRLPSVKSPAKKSKTSHQIQSLPESIPPKPRGSEDEAEAAFQSGEFSLAAQIYEYLLNDQRDNPKLYNRLGVIYLELERFHDAREAFRTALKFGDQVASRHANLAMAEYALGHRLTAVRHMKRAMALAPHSKRYAELLEAFEDNAQ